MKILLSNDDGVYAEGLGTLERKLSKFAELTVVAPDRDKSASSNSLTLENPLRVMRLENGYYCVNGTPTDCIHLCLTGWLDYRPDMVISGINAGSNLGDDVLYSGTVAAAMEGRFMGLPAIAISLASESNEYEFYDTAAYAIEMILKRYLEVPLPHDILLNVNVPDIPIKELKGMRVTRLGQRHRSEEIVAKTDPRGKPIYWVGAAGAAQDAGTDTDFCAVKEGYVSITPLQVDLTRYGSMEILSEWFQSIR